MKRNFIPTFVWFLMMLAILMSACGQTGAAPQSFETQTGPEPTLVDYPPAPALRVPYTPEPNPGTHVVTIDEAGLSLTLPGDWIVNRLSDSPIGQEYALAPQALIDFAESHVIVVDLEQVSSERAIEWLCGPQPGEVEPLALESGLQAQHIPCWVDSPNTPRMDWYFAEHNGKLVFLSVNDPVSRQPLLEWIHSMKFVLAAEMGESSDASSLGLLPQSCQVVDQQAFVNRESGYCFAYPKGFTLDEGSLDSRSPFIYGPVLDQSPDPVRVSLGVTAQPLPEHSNLGRIVDDFLSQREFEDLPWEIGRAPLSLGGEPAEALEDVPGRLSSRLVMAIHGEMLYTLTFFPSDLSEAGPGLETLFEMVTGSFAFLEDVPTQPVLISQQASWTEFGANITLAYAPTLAPWVEVGTAPAVPASPGMFFAASHPAYAQFRFLGYGGGREYNLPLLPNTNRVAQVMVFQVEDFAGFGDDAPNGFQNQERVLADLLQNGLDASRCNQPLGEGYQPLPFLPWINETQTFCAQPQVLGFIGGKGIRYLSYYAQGPAPVLDGSVFYTFQGLTDDGQFYVSAVFPIATGIFPDELPDQPTISDSGSDYSSEWLSTLTDQLAQLNAQAGDSFDPSLATLDELVNSIHIEKP